MGSRIETYRNVGNGTVSSRHVVIRLYETAEAHLNEAVTLLADGEDPTSCLFKAQQIVGGLLTALDLEAGDMARKLLQLYLFVLERIRVAHEEHRDPGLAAAVEVLARLREGFETMPAEEAHNTARPLTMSAVGLHLKG
ncbi:MAG: flagellar protein FliS [bacterium]